MSRWVHFFVAGLVLSWLVCMCLVHFVSWFALASSLLWFGFVWSTLASLVRFSSWSVWLSCFMELFNAGDHLRRISSWLMFVTRWFAVTFRLRLHCCSRRGPNLHRAVSRPLTSSRGFSRG